MDPKIRQEKRERARIRNQALWKQKKEADFLTTFPKRPQRIIKEDGYILIEELKSQYIWGDVGVGKTIMACKQLIGHAAYHTPLDNRHYIYVTMLDILSDIKDTFHPNSSMTEKEIVKKYSNIRYLLIDDFGIEKITDWSYMTIYQIINNRYENELTTIFTSNLSLDDLENKLDDDGRISQRIFELCGNVHKVKGRSKRK